MTPRHIATAFLMVVAVALLFVGGTGGDQHPSDPTAFSLRGRFVGPHAGHDAAAVACLCAEVADCIAWDGEQPEPMLKTGTQFADLRRRARELRMQNDSIGNRQPHVREAIKQYLDEHVGVDGGPVDAASRGRWVAAFREIGRAASDALK